MRLKRDQLKVFDHAVDFLAALARHVPRARQQTVTYAGHYANATGNLSLKKDEAEQKDEQEVSVQPGGRRYVPWNLLVLRCWAVDPELCPRCGERMERDKPVYKQPALSQLLKSLRVGKYPQRPPPAPPPQTQAASNHDSEYSNAQQFGEVLLEEYNVVQLFPDDNLLALRERLPTPSHRHSTNCTYLHFQFAPFLANQRVIERGGPWLRGFLIFMGAIVCL